MPLPETRHPTIEIALVEFLEITGRSLEPIGVFNPGLRQV